jgi:hypothetical protein
LGSKIKSNREKLVEEVKMLSDKIDEPLLDLDKCSLNELINILQSFSNHSFNVHQTGFGSYIANHVIIEKIQRYNNEALIPPKLGDVWIKKTCYYWKRITPCYIGFRIKCEYPF